MHSTDGSPTDRLLTASLLTAPLLYLLADTLYATRGWADPTAGVVHVVAATAYALVLLRWVTWTGGRSATTLLVVGLLGVAGNVAYGFNTLHVALGDTDLVDATGAATIIKPLGLCFPSTLLVAALVLRRARPGWTVAVLAAAGLAWPVAHIADIGWLAVLVNVALVVCCAGMAARGSSQGSRTIFPAPGRRSSWV